VKIDGVTRISATVLFKHWMDNMRKGV